jgi:hypothetical protein
MAISYGSVGTQYPICTLVIHPLAPTTAYVIGGIQVLVLKNSPWPMKLFGASPN